VVGVVTLCFLKRLKERIRQSLKKLGGMEKRPFTRPMGASLNRGFRQRPDLSNGLVPFAQ